MEGLRAKKDYCFFRELQGFYFTKAGALMSLSLFFFKYVNFERRNRDRNGTEDQIRRLQYIQY